MKTCPVCLKNPAQSHSIYGVLPCTNCQTKRTTQTEPAVQVEFTSESIKYERNAFGKSIIQPYRSGELSREYLELYGTKRIKPTKEQIKNAKYVWQDTFSRNMDLKKSR